MNPQQFLLIVWARRKLALALMLLTIIGTVAVSFFLPKQYLATTSLVFDIKADPLLGAVLPGMASPSYIATQTDIIKSDRVAARVVKLLRLDQSPAAIDAWKEATNRKVPIDLYYADLLQRGLAIMPAKNSNVMTLNYMATDPQFAASAANAFAQAYIDVNIELRVEPARQYAAWFDERLRSLRGNLEKAQAKLSAFQIEKNIVGSDTRIDTETARLNSLVAQLAEAQGQRADANSRQKNTGTETSIDVMQNSVIQGIKSEIAKSEANLNQISRNVGKNHPQYQQLQAQIDGLNQQLAEEIRRISGGLASAGRVSAQKEEELKTAIEAQKKRVLDLQETRDAISVLVRDVETAQRAYESVSQRMTQTNLESQTQQTNVSVLSIATEPTEAAKPHILKNALASVLVGTLLGIAVAFGLEMLSRRVRVPDDLRQLEGVPLLGMLQPEANKFSYRDILKLVWSHVKKRKKRFASWRRARKMKRLQKQEAKLQAAQQAKQENNNAK